MDTPTLLPSANPRVRPVEHPFRHCMPMQIRFTDIDMLGHLNNNIYLQFMDLAKIDYFENVLGRRVDMSHLNMVVVNVEIDFLSATFFGEQVEVWTQTTHIGNKSLRLEQRVVESSTREIKAVARTVMAGYDAATNHGMAIQPEWRRAICAFEKREID